MKQTILLFIALITAFTGFAQNVGIGTASPTSKLTVNGSQAIWNDNALSFFIDAGLSQKGYVGINTSGGHTDLMLNSTPNLGWLRLGANNGAIVFYPNGDAITAGSVGAAGIYPTGNMGIGIANPSYKLDVAGNGRFNNGAGTFIYVGPNGGGYYGDALNLLTQIPTGGNFYMANNGIDGTRVAQADGSMRIGGPNQAAANLYVYGGRVGIGTASPAHKLDVIGEVKADTFLMTAGATAGYIMQSDATGKASWVNPASLSTGTNIYTADGTLTANRTVSMGADNLTFTGTGTVITTGNVGIGTTNASATYPATANRLYVNAPQQTTNLSAAALKLEQFYVDMGSSNLWGPSLMFNTNNNIANSTWNCGAISGVIGTPGNTGAYPGGLAFSTKAADGTTIGQPIERMRITMAGNVGIGTNAPAFKLHVPSGYIGTDYFNSTDNSVSSGVTGVMVKCGDNYHRTATAAALTTFLNTNNGYIQNQYSTPQSANFWITGNAYAGNYFSAGNYLNSNGYLYVSYNAYLYSNTYVGGYLGVGTSNPGVPVDINNYANVSTGSVYVTNSQGYNSSNSGYQYRAVDGNNNTGYSNSAANYLMSLRAQYAILTCEVFLTSDARIKHIEGRSDAAKDLATLCRIKVTDYQMRDQLHYAGQKYKKVIAQDLQQVYPTAVKCGHLATVIPNIYAKPTHYTIDKKELTAIMPQAPDTNVKTGSRCRYYVEDKAGKEVQMMGTVNKIEGNTLHITTDSLMDPNKVASIFLYGVEINDLLSVDYDAISMLNVSATQELNKKVETLENEIAAQQNTNSHLQSDVDKLKASVETLQEMIQVKVEK